MVDTADLAAAYAEVVGLMRSAPYELKNRLLVMGNYWGGLHAQVGVCVCVRVCVCVCVCAFRLYISKFTTETENDKTHKHTHM